MTRQPVANVISMKCRKKECNVGKNSSSLSPSRKANTPLKLTSEISCICRAVCFLAKGILLQNACNDVDLRAIDDVGFGSIEFVDKPCQACRSPRTGFAQTLKNAYPFGTRCRAGIWESG